MSETVFLIGAALAAALLWRMRPRRGQSAVRRAGQPEADDDLKVVLHLAEHEARARHHEKIEPLHLLAAVMQNEEISTALGRDGADVDAIDAHFQRALADVDDTFSKAPRWSAESQHVLIEAAAEARAAQRDIVGVGHLANRLLRNYPELLAELETAGLSRPALLAAVAHGAEEPPLALAAGAQADVMLHNDDFTPMELVVALLCDVFDYERQAAIDTMMTVHNGPPTAVARYDASEAQRRVETATDRARASGFPLRLTLRAGAGESGAGESGAGESGGGDHERADAGTNA